MIINTLVDNAHDKMMTTQGNITALLELRGYSPCDAIRYSGSIMKEAWDAFNILVDEIIKFEPQDWYMSILGVIDDANNKMIITQNKIVKKLLESYGYSPYYAVSVSWDIMEDVWKAHDMLINRLMILYGTPDV